MTTPPAQSARPRWRQPAVILPAALALVILVVMLSPQPSEPDRVGRLTTYSAGASGAQGLYEVTGRLGWPRLQREASLDVGRPGVAPLDTTAVYLILSPSIPLTATEVHNVLDAVRRGAGLVYVGGLFGGFGDVGDSLHLGASSSNYSLVDRADPATCPPEAASIFPMWPDDTVHLYRLTTSAPLSSTDTVSFLRVRAPRGVDPPTGIAGLGLPLGSGRVLALADPDILRNDVIRACHWGVGVTVVEMLNWVSRDRRPTLVFDEYHQGFQGSQATTLSVTRDFLMHTALGRVLAQGIVAAIILLLALGIRPIAPAAQQRIERRSPLEHVDALAHAYAAVGATRVAVRRLVRGLERRHGHGAWLAAPSLDGNVTTGDRFLTAVAARYAAVAQDVALVMQGEAHRVSPAELVRIAHAVARIDRILNAPPAVPTVAGPLQPEGTIMGTVS